MHKLCTITFYVHLLKCFWKFLNHSISPPKHCYKVDSYFKDIEFHRELSAHWVILNHQDWLSGLVTDHNTSFRGRPVIPEVACDVHLITIRVNCDSFKDQWITNLWYKSFYWKVGWSLDSKYHCNSTHCIGICICYGAACILLTLLANWLIINLRS